VSCVVLDIEGTTSPAAFVYEQLYPYARSRFASWLAEHSADEDVARAMEQVHELIGDEGTSMHRVVSALEDWSLRDLKITPLKTVQGRIWADGFAAGELTAPFFPDVIPALRTWREVGLDLYIYSSGSVNAQRAWFGHTPEGDLRSMLRGYFDTENAGPKKVTGSYSTIAGVIGCAAPQVVFLSDSVEELDAARAANWRTVGVRRPGEPNFALGVGDHLQISSFAELRGDWLQRLRPWLARFMIARMAVRNSGPPCA
jgi:2,3-diketo-5-methylthio-1-phosphopentane phosphatase